MFCRAQREFALGCGVCRRMPHLQDGAVDVAGHGHALRRRHPSDVDADDCARGVHEGVWSDVEPSRPHDGVVVDAHSFTAAFVAARAAAAAAGVVWSAAAAAAVCAVGLRCRTRRAAVITCVGAAAAACQVTVGAADAAATVAILMHLPPRSP